MAEVRTYSPEEKAEVIRRYFKSGLSVTDFAKSPECPVHVATLYRWLKEHAHAQKQEPAPEPETTDTGAHRVPVDVSGGSPDEERLQVVSPDHDPLWSMLERSRDEIVEAPLPKTPPTVTSSPPETIPGETPVRVSLAIPETVRRYAWAALGVAASALVFLATRTLGARLDAVRQTQPEVYQHVPRNPSPYDLPEFTQPF